MTYISKVDVRYQYRSKTREAHHALMHVLRHEFSHDPFDEDSNPHSQFKVQYTGQSLDFVDEAVDRIHVERAERDVFAEESYLDSKRVQIGAKRDDDQTDHMRFIVDMGRPVGVGGQSKITVVFKRGGFRIVTAYPS